ncbi:MAG: HAMP domain-containing protein [Myxococcales bacterium]|nr:HAMP domain-containing protein [Myxococcales bacterium]
MMTVGGRLRRLWGTFGVRLNLWYLLLFAGALAAGATVADVAMRSSVGAEHRARVQAALTETRIRYETVGLGGMGARPLDHAYVRLSDPAEGRLLFEHVPEGQIAPSPRAGAAPAEPGVRELVSPTGVTWSIATTTTVAGRVLEVGLDDHALDAVLGRLRSAYLIVLGTAMAIAVAGGILVTWRGRRPLVALRDTTERIVESGDLSQRVPARAGATELAQLGALFNTLLEKNQRLVGGMREALDAVAHDLRTPLTRLRTRAELALADPAVSEAGQEALADCVEESDRVLTMLASLMDLAEAEAGAMRLAPVAVDVGGLVAEVVDLYELVAAEVGVGLVAEEVAGGLVVSGDRVRLRQALANVVDNALKYTPAGGEVRVAAAAEAGEVVLSVTDTGPGIPADEQARVFERLYRGDRARSKQGLGLGLAMVRAIVVAHGGRVAVASAPGEGARFELRLPG